MTRYYAVGVLAISNGMYAARLKKYFCGPRFDFKYNTRNPITEVKKIVLKVFRNIKSHFLGTKNLAFNLKLFVIKGGPLNLRPHPSSCPYQ